MTCRALHRWPVAGTVLAVLLGLLAPTPAVATPPPGAGADADAPRVIARLAPRVGAARAHEVAAGAGLTVAARASGGDVVVADVPTGTDARAAAAALARRPEILWAEPDRRWQPAELTGDGLAELVDLVDDALADELWGLADIGIPGAWEWTRGDGDVVVAVIDTGVDITHPDLADRIWTNPEEIADNGVDDDGNGYVDDVHGWDFVNDDATVYDLPDVDAHGTHVAGTIAAIADNGIGVAGVAPDVTVLPLKFLGPDGGWTSDAILAFEYATTVGADVVNASWSGTGESTALQEAIQATPAVTVAAAGNEALDIDVSPSYPAAWNMDRLVAVAAINAAGDVASFSNTGAQTVDLAAPGVGILSTYPDGQYAYFSGTSMAAPHVAGAAALLASAAPALTPSQIAEALRATARSSTVLADATETGGLVDAAAALDRVATPPATVPDAPDDLVVDVGDGTLEVTWAAPSDDGGADVTGYDVALDDRASTTVNGTSTTFDDLENGRTYVVSVAAVNEVGVGPSVTAEGTPVGPAGPPRDLRTETGFRRLRATWSTPADDGGAAVSGYEVRLEPVGTVVTLDAQEREIGFTGLPADEPQTLTVRALTAVGPGDPVRSGALLGVLPAPDRVAGAHRFDTAARIAAGAFPDGATDVYVATGSGFADALAGTAVAAAAGAPILLVARDSVPTEVADELHRLAPERVWVLGGSGAVADPVLDQLRAITGGMVRRIAGPDRYSTGALISSRSFDRGVPVVYLATGRGFADALGAGAAAGAQGGPVLLTDPDVLPGPVAEELARLRPGRVVVLGGTAAVSEQVAAAAGRAAGAPVERRGGASRYDTSAAVVAGAFEPDVPAVYLATGEGFPDSLAGGAAAARLGAPVLLVPSNGPLPEAAAAELQRLRPARLVGLGGSAALSDAVLAAAHAATGG